jgi:hypothetical protein
VLEEKYVCGCFTARRGPKCRPKSFATKVTSPVWRAGAECEPGATSSRAARIRIPPRLAPRVNSTNFCSTPMPRISILEPSRRPTSAVGSRPTYAAGQMELSYGTTIQRKNKLIRIKMCKKGWRRAICVASLVTGGCARTSNGPPGPRRSWPLVAFQLCGILSCARRSLWLLSQWKRTGIGRTKRKEYKNGIKYLTKERSAVMVGRMQWSADRGSVRCASETGVL